MTHEPDPDDNWPYTYDDRDVPMSDDEPRSTYVPIEENPMNTHIGFSDPDPAIDDADDVATWDEKVVA